MGRKSSSKGQGPVRPSAPAQQGKGINPLIWGVLAVAVIVVGVLAFLPSAGPEGATSSAAAAPAADTSGAPLGPQASEAAIARAQALAALGPRQQTNLPPIPFQGYTPPRPVEVVTSAYEFAAAHPEILSYVPCFCGCEQAGHQGNHDCFVKSRDAQGNVVEWDEHGVTCAVCIDVANRSRQLHTSGANVRDIRTAIDKEFASPNAGQMPTPHPPEHSH